MSCLFQLSLQYSIEGFLNDYHVPSVYVKAYDKYTHTDKASSERYSNQYINFGIKDTKGWRSDVLNISMHTSVDSQTGIHEGYVSSTVLLIVEVL